MFDDSDLSSMTDEQLVHLGKKSKKAINVLISRYAKIVYYKAYQMLYNSNDADDLIQEGMLALLNAADTYKHDMDTKFSTYANVCISNRMITAVKKRSSINNAEASEFEIKNKDISKNPEQIIIEREYNQEIFNTVASVLSDKEWQIFRFYLTGFTYDQMSQQLNISLKSVDNAMQRVRRKLKTVWGKDIFMK